jgi:sigma-B regulation protein RsbU (phosphoserine phosphatase)
MTQPTADRLASLYRISQAFNSSLDLGEVLNRVMDEVIAATHAERGFLMLREPHGRLGFRVARGMDQRTIESPEFQVSRGLVERVADEGRPLLTSNAQDDTWLGGRTSVRALGLRAVLCVPLQVKGTTIGVIYVDNRLQAGIFSPDDVEMLVGISSSAAIAIENARLYLIAVEKGRMEHELQVAHEVQASLIPHATPQIDGWDFAAVWRPAREVSGDFYDFIPSGEARLGVVIADVTDKGMPAALFMAHTRSIIRASASSLESPARALTSANKVICADCANGMFVTLCLTQLDLTTGGVVYVNAGHNPPLIYHRTDDQLLTLRRTGLPLGIDEAHELDQATDQLQSGDFILLYTDGVTDAMDANLHLFGLEPLKRLVHDNRLAGAGVLLSALVESLDAFMGASAPADDITIAVVKRL